MKFPLLCTLIVVLSLLTSYGLAPLLWDAAGAIEEIINATYRIDITVNGG